MIVLVPYRPDNGHRDTLWTFLHEHYWQPLGYDVVVGEHLDGPFNRSKAINDAANRDWDLAVIADTDTFVPVKQLEQAIAAAKTIGCVTAAFDSVVEINQACTLDIIAGRISLNDSFATERIRRRELETQSSMLVVPRTAWDIIGGFDERFQGWAGEDNAFWHAAALTAGTLKITGNAYHLWHPTAPGKQRGPLYHRNVRLWKQYQSATTEQELRAVQHRDRRPHQ